MISRSLTPSPALQQSEGAGPFVFPCPSDELVLLLCVIEPISSEDTSADWCRVCTAGLGPFLFVPTRRRGAGQFAVDLPADVAPSDALRQLMDVTLSSPLRLRCVSTVSVPCASASPARSPLLLPPLRLGPGGKIFPANKRGDGSAVVSPVRAADMGAVCLPQLLAEASAFGAALVERFAVAADPLAERAARAVCFVRDFVATGVFDGGLADVLAAWAAALLERQTERPERALCQSSHAEGVARTTPRLLSVQRVSSPSGAKNHKLCTGTGAWRGGAGERLRPVLSVCDEVLLLAGQRQRSASSGADGFLPALLRRLAEDATRHSKDVTTGNECDGKDANMDVKHEEKKENSHFLLDTEAIRRGDIYPTSEMVSSADLLNHKEQYTTIVFFFDLDPLVDAESGGPFSNAFGGGSGSNPNNTLVSSLNGHPCYLAITQTDIILRSAFKHSDAPSRLILVIPRVSLMDVHSTSFNREPVIGVMRLQTRSCRCVWLVFRQKTDLDAAMQHLVQCDNAPYKNLTLACAQRSWRMLALALVCGEVLPEPHEPFYKQALHNVLVAATSVEDRRRRRQEQDTEDFFDYINDVASGVIAGGGGGGDAHTMPLEKRERTESLLMETTHPHSTHINNSNNTKEGNDGKKTHLVKSDPTHWWLYSALEEYYRQKVPSRQWKLTDVNSGGRDRQLSTYPERFVVPQALDDAQIICSAALRKHGRVEALTFYYHETSGGIVRMAQPAAINLLVTPDSSATAQSVTDAYNRASGIPLCCFDLRGQMNAIGNTFVGGGFAMEVSRFCSLGNIHDVRNDYELLCAEVHKGNPSFSAAINAVNSHVKPGHGGANCAMSARVSAWLNRISALLRTAVDVARLVTGVSGGEALPPVSGGEANGSATVHLWTRAFTNISSPLTTPPPPASYRPLQRQKATRLAVLNCSDGWDRTPQVCALAALLIDPYYRTAEGFLVLIEKEFVAFGHPSLKRATMVVSNVDEPHRNSNGNASGGGGGGGKEKMDTVAGERLGTTQGATKSKEQSSPILLQFFDAVHQLIRLYPNCFEITETFLLLIVDVMHAGIVGTFAVNCEADVKEWNVAEETLSLSQFFAVLLATTIPSNTSNSNSSSIHNSSDPNPPHHSAPLELSDPKDPLLNETSNSANPGRHPEAEEEERGGGDADESLSMRVLRRIGGGGPSCSSSSPCSPSSSPLGIGAPPSWRRLPVSRDAMEHSGLLNPQFSLLENQWLVGPLLDPLSQSYLALWEGFFLRHSHWCARRLQLRRRRAWNCVVECDKQLHRRPGIVSASEMQAPTARRTPETPLGRPTGGGMTPRTLAHQGSSAALSTLPQQKQSNHAHARAGVLVATVGGGQDDLRMSSPNGVSGTFGAAPRQAFGLPPPLSASASSLGDETMSSQSVEATQQTRNVYALLLDQLDQAYDE